MTDLSLFFDVFDYFAFAYAIATGMTTGATVLLYLSLRFPPMNIISIRLNVALLFGVLALLGTIFFAGQITVSIASDPAWPRALARYALWLVFCGATSVGFGIARSFAKRPGG